MKMKVLKILRLLGFPDIYHFLIIALLTACVYFSAVYFEAFEQLKELLIINEDIELDEFFFVILILFLFAMINVIIRGAQLEREVDIRKKTEKKLIDIIEGKDLLMKEFNHRVKNNYQIINSILELKRSMNPQKELDQIFTDIINRIYSMSVIHEKLHKNDSTMMIDLNDYINEMAEKIIKSASGESDRINLIFNSEKIEIDAKKAIYCGLIFNELITNSIKHAFNENTASEKLIKITMTGKESAVSLSYSDSGIGLAGNPTPSHGKSLGFMLVTNLITSQLEGTFELREGRGFKIDFSFPL